MFLQTPAEQFWLRANGITATSVEALQPLTDAADAALCLRMDSTLATLQASYFRAGAFVIGTIEKTIVDDTTASVMRADLGSPIFVFDSVGTWIHKGGKRLIPPPDLRVIDARPGVVRLAWSNRSRDATGLRLQRASAASGFTNIGSVVPPTSAGATDSSASSGMTYRYRVAVSSTNGDSAYSNVATVTLTDIGSVSRTVAGMLFRDQFNRADGPPGASWAVESGGWTIVNNALQITVSPGQNAVARAASIADRKDFHIQLSSSRSNLVQYAAIYARRAGGTMYLADLGSLAEYSGMPRLYRQTGGGYALLGYGQMTSVANVAYRLTFSVLGSSLRFYADGTRLHSVAESTPANNINGHFALNAYGQGGASGVIRIDDVVVCTSRTVTMAGLPAGHRLRVGGVWSNPAGADGIVNLDLLATPLPVAQLEILDGDNAVVKVHAPANGVCGGDAFALASAP